MFAASSGRIHPAHCRTRRDVAFFRADRQLAYIGWRRADKIEVQFRGHKGDQDQRGNVRVRTRDESHGPRSGYRADGGAVALMVELLSCHPTLPDSGPLSSYRSGREVKVWKYDQALRAFREIVEKSGRNPKRIRVAFATDRRGVHPSSGRGRIRSSDPEGGPMGLRGVQDVHSVQRRGCETSFP